MDLVMKGLMRQYLPPPRILELEPPWFVEWQFLFLFL